MIYILLSFIISVVVSALLLPWLLNLCYSNGLFDSVNARKQHRTMVPRLGGVIFMPAAVISAGLTFLAQLLISGSSANILHLSSVVVGVGIMVVYFIGVLDDLVEAPARVKFLGQFLVACLFPMCGLYFNSLYGFLGIDMISHWVGYPLTIIVVLLIVNAINLIDGIDGVAAGLSLFSFSVYLYVFNELGYTIFGICIAGVIGALLVYLPYNLWGSTERHTKTFMGDSGSLVLGVLLAYLTLKYSMCNQPAMTPHANGLVVAYSVVLIPCFDLCRVALCRLRRGVSIFDPDRTHLHHKLMATGLGMHPAAFLLILMQVAFFALNFFMYKLGLNMAWIVFADVLLFTLLNVYLPVEKTPVEFQEPTSNIKPTSVDVNSPLVSIVVSTYNSAATLRDTFESILAQTYTKYEVVLIDGASKDGTMTIVEEYKTRFGDKLSYISEPDRGLYEAMNKGLLRAKGDVVGTLNSDDFYTSATVLERIAMAFTDGTIDAVYGDVHYVDAANAGKLTRYYSSRMFSPGLVRFGFMPAHPSFYCRRDIIVEKGLFNLAYSVAADFDQLLRLTYIHRIRTRYLSFDFVTMREGGTSNAHLSSRMAIMSEHNQILHSHQIASSTFLLSLRYIYKILEVVLSPYLYRPKLPSYIHLKR